MEFCEPFLSPVGGPNFSKTFPLISLWYKEHNGEKKNFFLFGPEKLVGAKKGEKTGFLVKI
eukprot:NODE_6382_length_456_cov_22.380835_g4854_i0.p2 GENE.NODE_6382_length_456_cov_22.380835_g4854_i0~~NODE_6382_length_456_cov_22.380835_g4854_i0.p2  ORF type:complete len:61 (+),score=0.49 NODE_6382_length_456_cov_22.380835_g4854_i0:227-409(+)